MNDKPVRITKTETLLTAIEGLGEDKNSLPIGIRTAELAAKTGVPANSIQMLLAPHVASGRLCVCRVTLPGRPQQNEYRRGAGVPSPVHIPLNPKRAGIALGQPGKPLPVTIAAPSVTRPRDAEPVTPVFLSSTTPQAQVGKQRQPATRKASAGSALRLSIDQDGALQMGDEDDPARWVFTPEQVLAMGDFLHATEQVWRP